MKRFLAIGIVGFLACTTTSDPPSPSAANYETTQYFVGLDELVRIVKTPGEVYAVRADGTRVGYLALFDMERVARRARFGSLTPELQRELNADHARTFRVGVGFQLAIDWPAMESRMASTDEATHAAAYAELASLVGGSITTWQPKLEALGLHVTTVGQTMPVIFGATDAAGVLKLRELDGVRVWLNGNSRVMNDSIPDTLGISHIDFAFDQPSAAGIYAASQRIGILETMGASKIYDAHEAFTYASVQYQPNPPTTPTCSTVAQCGCAAGLDACGDCSANNVACSGTGSCVSDHTSKTASVISSYNAGQLFSSAKAGLYIWNGGAGDYASNLGAFQWFSAMNVGLVNMSFSYSNPEGPVEDYYSRLGILVMKSAGDTWASNLNGSCAYQANALCVGAVQHNMTMFWPSGLSANPWGSDRQEPDLVALGGENTSCAGTVFAMKANTTSINTWTGFFNATSASTPVITSMMALTREYCLSQGHAFTPRWARLQKRRWA